MLTKQREVMKGHYVAFTIGAASLVLSGITFFLGIKTLAITLMTLSIILIVASQIYTYIKYGVDSTEDTIDASENHMYAAGIATIIEAIKGIKSKDEELRTIRIKQLIAWIMFLLLAILYIVYQYKLPKICHLPIIFLLIIFIIITNIILSSKAFRREKEIKYEERITAKIDVEKSR